MLRKTKSLTIYIQQAMRSMRYQAGKTAIIIDHVMNCYEHGLPDEDRDWSLGGKLMKDEKERGEGEVKECPECHAVSPINAKVCENCGYVFIQSEEKLRIYGELKEITPEMLEKRKKFSFKDIKTFEQLVECRQELGYKYFWIFYKALELGIEIPKQYEHQEKYARRKKSGASA